MSEPLPIPIPDWVAQIARAIARGDVSEFDRKRLESFMVFYGVRVFVDLSGVVTVQKHIPANTVTPCAGEQPSYACVGIPKMSAPQTGGTQQAGLPSGSAAPAVSAPDGFPGFPEVLTGMDITQLLRRAASEDFSPSQRERLFELAMVLGHALAESLARQNGGAK